MSRRKTEVGIREIARESGVADVCLNDSEAAGQFIAFFEDMNARMNIPEKLKAEEADIPELARHADREANPLYPVPRLMNAAALEDIYRQIKE